jgi:hypothetical protein
VATVQDRGDRRDFQGGQRDFQGRDRPDRDRFPNGGPRFQDRDRQDRPDAIARRFQPDQQPQPAGDQPEAAATAPTAKPAVTAVPTRPAASVSSAARAERFAERQGRRDFEGEDGGRGRCPGRRRRQPRPLLRALLRRQPAPRTEDAWLSACRPSSPAAHASVVTAAVEDAAPAVKAPRKRRTAAPKTRSPRPANKRDCSCSLSKGASGTSRGHDRALCALGRAVLLRPWTRGQIPTDGDLPTHVSEVPGRLAEQEWVVLSPIGMASLTRKDRGLTCLGKRLGAKPPQHSARVRAPTA